MKILKANYDDAIEANKLLTKLIKDEKQYDNNINQNCVVSSLYEKFYDSNEICLLVAKENKKVIGYLYGFITNNGDSIINKVSQLDAVYINESHRNKGVASSLIKEFEKWSIKKNVKYIELKVCNQNNNAINLYKGLNFEPSKIIMQLKLEDKNENI